MDFNFVTLCFKFRKVLLNYFIVYNEINFIHGRCEMCDKGKFLLAFISVFF